MATLRESPNRMELVKRRLEFDVNNLSPKFEERYYEVVTDFSGKKRKVNRQWFDLDHVAKTPSIHLVQYQPLKVT